MSLSPSLKMDIRAFSKLLVICWAVAYTCLAPSLSQVGNITKPKSVPEILGLVTVSSFPPGPSPEGPYEYHVRYSNVILNFTHYALNHHRNELEVEAVIQQAIAAADPSLRRITMSAWPETWSSGSLILVVIPSQLSIRLMTWGTWANALIGLNHFRLAYPGLDVCFRILLRDERHGHILTGLGTLYTGSSKVTKPLGLRQQRLHC